MLASTLAAAIAAARSGMVLDALSKAIWSGLAGGHLTEDQAHEASQVIEGRRGELRRPMAAPAPLPVLVPRLQTLFARARAQRPPDKAAAWARRRQLAASGPLPPALAAHFTTAELAVLRIIGDEAGAKGACDRTFDELAARAGVSRSSARNAVRQAVRLGLLTKQERPRPGRKHLANVLRVVSAEWRQWLVRKGRAPQAKSIGVKNVAATGKTDRKGLSEGGREQGRSPGRGVAPARFAPSQGRIERG